MDDAGNLFFSDWRSEESTSLTQSSVFRIRDGRIQLIGGGGYDYGLSGDKWR